MQTYPYALSRKLTDWIHQLKEDIRVKLQTVGTKEEFMTKTIKSLPYLSEVWYQFVHIIDELKAPTEVIYEAYEVASILGEDLQGKAYSSPEQEELLALLHPVTSAKTPADKLSIVEEAIRQGKLSKRLGDRFINAFPIPHHADDSQQNKTTEPVMLMLRFKWSVCGFCGALALEGGALGAAVACAICGVLA